MAPNLRRPRPVRKHARRATASRFRESIARKREPETKRSPKHVFVGEPHRAADSPQRETERKRPSTKLGLLRRTAKAQLTLADALTLTLTSTETLTFAAAFGITEAASVTHAMA